MANGQREPLTTTLAIWLCDFCQRRSLEQGSDARLSLASSGTRALNAMMRSFYEQDLWLNRASKNLILNAGYHFLQAGSKLALVEFSAPEKFLSNHPQAPYHVSCFENHRMAGRTSMPTHGIPLSEFCALDEDFIGRIAKVSRNVSPRLACQRVVERYLLYCRGHVV